MRGTTIILTPPSLPAVTIQAYNSVSTQQSTTDRAGSFTLSLPFHSTADITAYSVGTDVQITQGTHNFRGFVKNPPVAMNKPFKELVLEGLEYSAKTQNIIVTKSYTADYTLSYIVNDLVTTYLPWLASSVIESSSLTFNAKYPDVFLWDVLEEICSLSGFSWTIDYTLGFKFFSRYVEVNTASITYNNYHKGSANFSEDSSKLVNKLWIKGANAISTTTVSQTVSVTTANITLDYKPHEISVTIGTASQTVGIQNVDAPATKDFLLNFNEKLLVPDLVTTGTAVITYKYEYPIKILMYDNPSIATYGQIEDVLKVTTNDRNLATQIGITYLAKHKQPITMGTVSPFEGDYHAGQTVLVNIPDLNVNDNLIIKSCSYESTPTREIVIRLDLENRVDDITDILKQFSKRLDQLERKDIVDNEVVEQYRTFDDTVIVPILTDDGISYILHDYILCGMPYAGTFYV